MGPVMAWVFERSKSEVARGWLDGGLRQQLAGLLQDSLTVGFGGWIVLGGSEGVERVAARVLQKRVLVDEV